MAKNNFACRSCGYHELKPVLSLGAMPLANRLLKPDQLEQPEPVYPLDLVFCPHCSLAQITETVPPEVLFSEYLYFSSFSDALLRHARELAETIIAQRKLKRDSLVIEVASNDGYLLQYYQQHNIPVLGIDPAANIARVANERGIPTLCEFFGAGLARQLKNEGKQADVIHGHNVMAHVADLNGFVAGLATLLKDDGIVIIEAPYVKDTISHNEFDQIYHEHLCYFSATAVNRLFARHGLVLWDAEHLPIHGGTLRYYGAKAASIGQTERLQILLRQEREWGVYDFAFYQSFGRRVEQLKQSLRETLCAIKAQNQRIAAYGASAKGSTLLNYFQIGGELLDFVVDRSAVKQGHYTPGTHLPICAPEKLLEEMPDYALLLTWNFADEILEQQAAYRRRGGKFIIPIPELKVV